MMNCRHDRVSGNPQRASANIKSSVVVLSSGTVAAVPFGSYLSGLSLCISARRNLFHRTEGCSCDSADIQLTIGGILHRRPWLVSCFSLQ